MNKFLVLALLLGLLYGLYRYQQIYIDNETIAKIEPPKRKKKSRKQPLKLKAPSSKEEIDDGDNVSIGNISQVSASSIDKSNFKQDSLLNSLDSKESLSFLDNKSLASVQSNDTNKSFFFK